MGEVMKKEEPKVEHKQTFLNQESEDTYALSKRQLRRELDSLKEQIDDLDRRITTMGNDLERVMDRMGL
jgi:archaellum component FlaC